MSSSTLFIFFVEVVEWFYLLYFLTLNAVYFTLALIAVFVVPRYMKRQTIHALPQIQTGFEPPISLVVTAYNEEAVIVPTIRSLLQLDYPEFEIIIVNDGSKDRTLEVLDEAFDLVEFPAAFRQRISHKPVKKVYQSRKVPNLRVIDKENGGCKSDASNAGINGARFGIVTPLDSDTILDRDCLKYIVQVFMLNPDTIGVGGNVRVLNGCKVDHGNLSDIGISGKYVASFQLLEYMRAFLSGRTAWSAVDSLPLISGAFGFFNKESVITVGGYRHDCLGEDMELALRLHRHYRLKNKPYRLDFAVDAVCWTEVPESFEVLKKQRVRWQRGLFDAITMNKEMLFNPKSRGVGMAAMPFLAFWEGLSPLVETFGYIVFVIFFWAGLMSWQGCLAFLLMSLGTGVLMTTCSLLVEELSFKTYLRSRDVAWLFYLGIIENLGFRQVMAFWRLEGTYKWIRGSEFKWGEMTRVASWQAEPSAKPATPNLGQPAEKQQTPVASEAAASPSADA